MKTIKFIILSLFIFAVNSCKTYEKSVVHDYWLDKWNCKFTVFRVEHYYKKNDSLYNVTYDTTRKYINARTEVDLYQQSINGNIGDF